MSRGEIESLRPVRTFLDSKGRNSIDSRKTYLSGLHHFDNFLSPGHSVETVLMPLKEGEINVYELLDSFVTDQLNKVSKKSAIIHLTAVKSYLEFHDVDITISKFKKKVTLPRLHREDEQAIDASDIRKILLKCNNRRLKTYCLILASGGMRAVEALAIRIKDIDLSISPTKVHVRKEYAKTRVARDVYVSDEATQYLKEWIRWKYRNRPENKSDLVFGVGQSTDPRTLYKAIAYEFSKYLELAGFVERKEDSSRHKVTLHSFRRFVKTVVSDQTNQDYSEWFLGHSKSPYYTKKEPERREIYATKCMKYLTFLDYTTLEVTGKNIEAKLSEKDREIAGLKQKYDADIALLKEAMLDMQQLLKSPDKLAEISRAAKP
jgi:integrase